MKKFSQYLIPSVIASICMSMYAIIDGLFIGIKLSDYGLAAVNVAWPITACLQSIGVGIGISSGIYISRLMAKGREVDAQRTKLSAILSLLVVGLILGGIFYLVREPLLKLFQAEGEVLTLGNEYITIILYGAIFQVMGYGMLPLLKNSGRIKQAFIASIAAIAFNLGLDYLLIMVLDMGLAGAAIASVLAQVISFLICFIAYLKELKGISYDLECYKEIFLGSLAPFILNYSSSVIIIITNALCASYQGDEALAAYGLLSYILYIVAAASQGVSDAIQPLFSFNHEIRNYKKCRVMLKDSLIISFSIVTVIVIIIALFRNQLIDLYNLSDYAGKLFIDAIPYYFTGFVLISLIRVISSYLYSINNKLFANIITISEPFILTPIVYLCMYRLSINGLWISFLIIQALLLALAVGFLYKQVRKDLVL